MKITIFPGKYHQNGGFSMAMLVYREGIIFPNGLVQPPTSPMKVWGWFSRKTRSGNTGFPNLNCKAGIFGKGLIIMAGQPTPLTYPPQK